MQKITPFLWYDHQALGAANFYVSIFPNSKIVTVTRYPKEVEEASGKKAGEVMTVDFELKGQKFTAINGGPAFKLSEAVSFVIECDDQKEVDYYWNKLADAGEENVCGWLKDKYGLSWQVTPRILLEMIAGPDPKKVGRAMKEVLSMKKIIIKDLEEAYRG
jgi:predicted 3-demethylubiquinone-9 3-methyltransferase (glyoxalase superfamily)